MRKFWFRLANAAVATVATAGLLLIQTDLWNPKHIFGWTVSLIVVLAGEAVGQEGAAAWRAYRTDRRHRFQEKARVALNSALLKLSRCGLDLEQVGVSAFLVRRRWWCPWRPILERIARVRLPSTPPGSSITWTKGKGVIGVCWETHNPVAKNTQQAYKAYMGCSKEKWKQVPSDVRMRMTHKDFVRIAQKYAGVVAVPIVTIGGRPKVVGCVSVDLRQDADIEPLLQNAVQEIAQDAALSIAAGMPK